MTDDGKRTAGGRASDPVPDVETASEIVRTASSRFLGTAIKRDRRHAHKDDGTLVTQTDGAIQRFVETALGETYPAIPFIGEEMVHARQLEVLDGAHRFWVLDPLDGTTNFVAGFPFYGISLALVEDDAIVLGVVHDPIRAETFTAVKGQGARLNGEPLDPDAPDRLGQCVANIDYKRLTRQVAERLVRAPPYRSQRNLGSCVLEWCWLAAGRFQLYLHGGQRLWDFAAGSLVLAEAGGVARGFEGGVLTCDSLSKRSVIAAVTPALFEQWNAWIARQGCLAARGAGSANP